MTFHSAHFGEGTLDSSSLTFSADRLFSALSIEALKLNLYDEFITLAQQDDFVLSDAFPYNMGPFLPKPIGYPKFEHLNNDLSVKEVRQNAKKNKKLEYIELDVINDFLNGEVFDNYDFASKSLVTKNNPTDDNGLYQVSIMTYDDFTSLYVIANQTDLLDTLMMSLQFSGIGGKRSSGYGIFDLSIEDIPETLLKYLVTKSNKEVLLLTSALPKIEDLEQAMENGQYIIKKSSGFVFSTIHDRNFRKQDLYKFKAGSTFKHSFVGDIYDVRPNDFKHEVLNFAKPLFYELEI